MDLLLATTSPCHHRSRGSLRYGYGHYLIFAAAGAFSAGIEVEIDVLVGDSALRQPYASLAYTVPLAVFILGVWVLAIRPHADRTVNLVVPVGGLLVLVDPLIPVPFALTTVILVGVVIVLVWRSPIPESSPAGSE
nr:low temperature requirement protein A [Stackebrandtia endophytica]